jgi:cytochrome P450
MQEFEARKEPMNLTLAFPALTGDIIMDYFFGFNYDQLKHPEFDSFHDAFMKISATGHIATQFPFIFPLMNSIPDVITEWLQPAAKPLLAFKRDQWDLIGRTLRGEELKRNDAQRTIFQEILDSKLPDEDKSQQRLADEAQIVIGGGVETTAFALTIGVFHIINTPRIYEHLHADLVAALPNRSTLELAPLEQMPYLKACIMESVQGTPGPTTSHCRTRDTSSRLGPSWPCQFQTSRTTKKSSPGHASSSRNGGWTTPRPKMEYRLIDSWSASEGGRGRALG